MTKRTRQELKIAGRVGLAMAVAVAIAGCGAKTTLGTPPAGALNQYFAVGSSYGGSTFPGPDEWAVSMDSASKYFSADDLTLRKVFQFNPMKGTFTTANGFDVLTAQSGGDYNSPDVGAAVEIPGETALLVSAPVVFSAPSGYYPAFAVASNQCSALSGTGASGTFQFLELPLVGYANSIYNNGPEPIYGSVKAASTANADGSVSWKFSNFSTTNWAGVTATQADASGLCANSPTAFNYIINLTDQSAAIGVSPSGFFAWYEDVGTLECDLNGCPSLGYVGFLVPSTPMDTSTLVAGKYNGAELNVNGLSGTGSAISRPVVFGTTSGTGTTMTGGVFPNDDTTQTPDSSISINLGAQSTTTNGFYPSVTVTIPNVSAPLSGVAIAGSPGSKNAIFVAAEDGTETLFFFLYQQ